jgi:hypothetical protein
MKKFSFDKLMLINFVRKWILGSSQNIPAVECVNTRYACHILGAKALP